MGSIYTTHESGNIFLVNVNKLIVNILNLGFKTDSVVS